MLSQEDCSLVRLNDFIVFMNGYNKECYLRIIVDNSYWYDEPDEYVCTLPSHLSSNLLKLPKLLVIMDAPRDERGDTFDFVARPMAR